MGLSKKLSSIEAMRHLVPGLMVLLSILTSCAVNDESFSGKEQITYGKKALFDAIKRVDVDGGLAPKVKVITKPERGLDDPEAYQLTIHNDSVIIAGGSSSGVLYGLLSAAEAVREAKGLPAQLSMSESPAMKWRGISLQLMKLGKYNFAITPEEFPFFYDKSLWTEFMDFMAAQRFNYIILWNGHPFDYFVKFDRYTEAQQGMTDEQIRENHDMLKWLIREGAKRNIKFFFEFYNIHTSVYYQKAHGLPEQIAVPTPELAEYTKYSIARFVSEFPEVDLFVTPGEGLERKYSSEWINDVIFEAVKGTGHTPTIFMRAWFFDLEHAREVVGHYPDLYFVRKFNVEMIADTRTDPGNAEWAKLNGNFIVNIHLAANLEPFRWNPPQYIREIVKNNILSGANGIHLHPRKAWRWPYGSDRNLKIHQWNRDTLFFTAWSRYARDPDRDPDSDDRFWLNLLSERFGDDKAATHFLNSFEAGADVLPALQRLVWLGYDNHTIVSAGATLVQLQNSKGIPFLSLDPTMRISEYLDVLRSRKPSGKQTPVEFVGEKVMEAEVSLQEAQQGAALAKKNTDEAARIVSDKAAIVQVAKYYHDKLQALKAWTLLDAGIETEGNKKAFLTYLEQSVEDFEQLCQITDSTYESVSDVSANHPVRLKKVPYHWKDLLPVFRKELEIYKKELNTQKPPDYHKPKLKGLAGIFYSEPRFVDAQKPFPARELSFDWTGDTEIGRNWSARWFGYLKAPGTGDITISVSADRDVKVVVNGKSIIFHASGAGEEGVTIPMKKERFYPLEIYYDHAGGEGGFLKMEWAPEGHEKTTISGEDLWHSEAQEDKTRLLAELIKELQ